MDILKKLNVAVAEWYSWLEHHSIHKKFAGLIPGHNMYETTDGSLCLSLSLPLTLPASSPSKINNKLYPMVMVKKVNFYMT